MSIKELIIYFVKQLGVLIRHYQEICWIYDSLSKLTLLTYHGISSSWDETILIGVQNNISIKKLYLRRNSNTYNLISMMFTRLGN